ncbi:MAG: YitT family protein [Bacteroidales bacterium]
MILRTIRQYLIITFGLLMQAIGITQFLLPAKIVGGGVSGFSALMYYASEIPLSYTYFAVNAVLVTIAFIILGRHFGVKTIYGILVLTIFLKIIPVAAIPHVKDPLLSAIIVGILMGTGTATLFSQGGSGGGTDIVARIITKYRNISIGRVFLYCDILIISSSYFLYHSIETMVYGYVLIGVSTFCVDTILSGNKQTVQLFIFSNYYDAIANRITSEQKRGVTLLDAVGWYTKNEKKLLMILARKNEINNIYRIVKEEDAQAFISVASLMGVFGQGFETIKVNKKIDPASLIKKAAKPLYK